MSGDAESSRERIRLALSEVISTIDPSLAGRLEREPDSYLDLIELTNQSSEEMTLLLQSAVTSARLAGLSWERIGQRLGMSRQAAQQRFGGVREDGPSEDTGGKRRLYPVTAFNEMESLAAAGRDGWHSVGYGMYFHDLIRSDEQWEHLRVAAFGTTRKALEQEGWHRIGTMWFPWAYYARPTGKTVKGEGNGNGTAM